MSTLIWDSLTHAEVKVIVAARKGGAAVISEYDWRRPDQFAALKTDFQYRVRSTLVRALLLDQFSSEPTHANGVRIVGAFIVGGINLEGCVVSHNLTLQRCYVDCDPSNPKDVGLNITEARTQTIDLGGTRVAGIRGQRLMMEGGLFLQDGFRSDGRVRISGDISEVYRARAGSSALSSQPIRGEERLNPLWTLKI